MMDALLKTDLPLGKYSSMADKNVKSLLQCLRSIGVGGAKKDRDKNIQHQGFAGGHPPNY